MPKILLVTVTKSEAQAVLGVFLQASRNTLERNFINEKTYYYLGQIGGVEVFMVLSEAGAIGRGAAILTVRNAIDAIKPTAVIMVGIAFGIDPEKQNLGEIIVSKQIQSYESQKLKGRRLIPRGDRAAASTRLLDKFRGGDLDWQGVKVHFGLILSGEKLIADQTFRDNLKKIETEAIGGEMEGAGLYSAASDAGVDWILVKGICDWATESKNDEYQRVAAENAARFTLHVIQQGGLLGDNKPAEPVEELNNKNAPPTKMNLKGKGKKKFHKSGEQSWWTDDGARWFDYLSEGDAIENIKFTLTEREILVTDIIDRAAKQALRLYTGDLSSHSGRPVIKHILAVAKTVVEIGLDQETVAAAILHDVVEDGKLSQTELEQLYGERIGSLVASVSRYDDKNNSKSEANYQKDIFARVVDTLRTDLDNLPAIFIKLAEKLDHIRYSAPHFSYNQQQDIAQEIMKVYAPLAERLGVWKLKAELEDSAFKFLNHDAYNQIASKHKEIYQDSDVFLRQAAKDLEFKLQVSGIQASVDARKKHIYSTYEKMLRKGKRYQGVLDLLGLRVIVDDKQSCYSVLAIVHGLWKPIPYELDDYIANAKPNGYQALHTTVISKEGFALEVQIRTSKMHEIAEYGMAAHWRYKDIGEENESLNVLFDAWRKYLLTQTKSKGSHQFANDFRNDMLQKQIHVYYLPSGELINLPEGSTPIDLIYAIDEEKANWCVGAKIGESEVPLSCILHTGDRVTIITDNENLGPEREWYTFVKTTQAQEKIIRYFQDYPRNLNVAAGETILVNELKILGGTAQISDAVAVLTYPDKESMLDEIGSCKLNARDVVNKLFRKPYREDFLLYWARETARLAHISILDSVVSASCCSPELDEELIAVFESPVLRIHMSDCQNLEDHKFTTQFALPHVELEELSLETNIRIWVKDRPGLIHDITNIFIDEMVNILNSSVQTDGLMKIIDFRVELSYFTDIISLIHRVGLIQSIENVCILEEQIGSKPKWKIARSMEAIDFRLQELAPRSIVRLERTGVMTTFNASSITGLNNHKKELRKVIEKITTSDGVVSKDILSKLCKDIEVDMEASGEKIVLTLQQFGDQQLSDLIYQIVEYLDRRGCIHYIHQRLQKEPYNLFLAEMTGNPTAL
jgi:RelA/SpoT family (p)ppGpp synthetase